MILVERNGSVTFRNHPSIWVREPRILECWCLMGCISFWRILANLFLLLKTSNTEHPKETQHPLDSEWLNAHSMFCCWLPRDSQASQLSFPMLHSKGIKVGVRLWPTVFKPTWQSTTCSQTFWGRMKYQSHCQFLGKILRTSVQKTEETQWLLGNWRLQQMFLKCTKN